MRKFYPWPIKGRLRYKLFEHQRVGRTGGGIALLLNEAIDVRKVDSGERRSFEFGEWILKHGSSKLRLIVIYRIPYSAAHPVSTSVFLDEFPAYSESVVMSPEPLLIAGDLNIHVMFPMIRWASSSTLTSPHIFLNIRWIWLSLDARTLCSLLSLWLIICSVIISLFYAILSW